MSFLKKRPYPVEDLDSEWADDGTMPENVTDLEKNVVGHRIVSVRENVEIPEEGAHWWYKRGTEITLDNGKRVFLSDTKDCCARTELEKFLLHPEMVDHVITGVGTTEGYTVWHVYADFGDVLELSVDWSCGNPFWYAYGFNITVVDPEL